ncbi:unnamed protein product, partial [Nesidiocoris tenuis]
MSQCFAYGCDHREMHETCQFFRFPKDPKTFKRWRDMSRWLKPRAQRDLQL